MVWWQRIAGGLMLISAIALWWTTRDRGEK